MAQSLGTHTALWAALERHGARASTEKEHSLVGDWRCPVSEMPGGMEKGFQPGSDPPLPCPKPASQETVSDDPPTMWRRFPPKPRAQALLIINTGSHAHFHNSTEFK